MAVRQAVTLFFFVSICTLTTVATLLCDDVSKNGCIAFSKAVPNMCSDQALSSNCKRFCNLCPLECYHCPTPVRDPLLCNVTQPCGANQTCLLSELLARDGHREYIMSCAAEQICEGFPFGFGGSGSGILGKRFLTQRGVSFSCCDTDNCNRDKLLSTIPPTTTPKRCVKDIAVALDSSGSIGPSNFQHIKDFLAGIISAMDVGPYHTQISLDTFSSKSSIQWFLNTYKTRDQMLQALENVSYISGATHTELALQHLMMSVFTAQHGDRPNVKNAVLVVTDGHSTNPQGTATFAHQLHNVSDNVIGVGIGQNVDHQELTNIATNRNHTIDVTDFNQLSAIVNTVVNLLCAR